jgi:phosphoribosyl 1,2-cyclic phosphodiesterase
MVRLTILGSGSAGNCTLVEANDTHLLIDAGLSGRQIQNRLSQLGKSLDEIDGVLLTHEHSDHTIGLARICQKRDIPIYTNPLTAECIKSKLNSTQNWKLFTTGDRFSIGNWDVETFPVPHDAYDPVGFVLRFQQVCFGFLTDLGHATRLVIERIRQCQALLLEANHDLGLLQDDQRRPWSVKQRILSRHGHLSNDGAAQVLREMASQQLKHLFLGHLSSDCNRPELARNSSLAALETVNASHVTVEVAPQDCATTTLEL